MEYGISGLGSWWVRGFSYGDGKMIRNCGGTVG